MRKEFQMLPTFSQNLTLKEAFETVAQMNKDQKRTEFDMHFAKTSNFWSIDFLHLLAKRRKLVEEVIHQKKTKGHRTSKIVKSRKSYTNGHLPYHCSCCYLARAHARRGLNDFPIIFSAIKRKKINRTKIL